MPPAKILIAVMPDGSAVSREFSQAEDSEHRKEFYFRQFETHHKANLITLVDLATGKAEVLKNRFGPPSRYPDVDRQVARLTDLIKALEAGNYSAAPTQLVQGGGLRIEPELRATCQCDIKNLMSTGHDPECPEKTR